MTTKEQERQAIAKIRRIVEGLGENSYVGTAMEGVLEVAEENIEYDAAFSLKGRAELAEKNEKFPIRREGRADGNIHRVSERGRRESRRCNL